MIRVLFPGKSNFLAPLLAIRELHDDIRLRISPNNIQATVLDSTHVSVTFVNWVCTTEGSLPAGGVDISIKISSLIKAIGLGSSTDDRLTWVIDSTDKMLIEMEGGDVTMELKLFDFDSETMEQPDLTPGATFDIPGSRLAVSVRDLSTIGDTVCIKASVNPQTKEASLIMVTEGDIGRASIAHSEARLLQYATDTFPEESQSFGLRYLVTILKAATKPQQSVNISLTKDTPLLIGISNESMCLSYYLAPKFDEQPQD